MSSLIEQAHTLDELIDAGRDNTYNIKDCSYLVTIGDSVLAIDSIFNKYIDFIKDASVKLTLTDDELFKYKYNPKRLSLDLYKTPELWYLLLKLNNISHEMDFTKKNINIIHPNNISLLNKIFILTEDDANDNHSENIIIE